MQTPTEASAPARAHADTPAPQRASSLLDLMDPEDYRLQRANHLLPTGGALDWFLRLHRAELIEGGALLKIANRWKVLPDRLDEAIFRIGQRMARAS